MFLDYAGIRVTQLRKSVRFFTKGLGLVELRRGTMGHGGVWVLLGDRVSHQQLELNWYPKGSKYATPFIPGEGLDHLGVRVRSVEAAGRRLRAVGARKIFDFQYRRKKVVAYYEAPDGIWVELIRTPELHSDDLEVA